MRQLPEHVHHFSWHTKVSLELPLGFEEESEDPAANAAVYADDLDEDDLGGRVLATATAVPEGRDDAYTRLAEESAALDDRTVASREETTIDGLPAVRQVLRERQDDLEVVRHETVAQIANVVFSITGLAPADRAEEYLPVFDRASRTARFVLL